MYRWVRISAYIIISIFTVNSLNKLRIQNNTNVTHVSLYK